MSENTKLWDILGRTDPKHTKPFKRAGGFSGTAIKPMWSYRRMTEEFGPCGQGWGVGEPTFQIVPGVDKEVLVYCTASIWYTEADGVSRTVYGVGGDKIVTHIKANDKYKTQERWQNDDEAFKKAFTDAVTNALKMIGVGADVHMGMFDDSKYVNTMLQEFAEDDAAPPPSPPPVDETYAPPPRKANGLPEVGWREDGSRTSFWLKNDPTAAEVRKQLQEDAADCHTILALDRLKRFYRGKASELKWNRQFKDVLAEDFGQIEQRILASLDNAQLAEMPLKETLQKSLRATPDEEAAMLDDRARTLGNSLVQNFTSG
jgi:hypothetical protein